MFYRWITGGSVILVVLVSGWALWLRGDMIAAQSERDKAHMEVTALKEANRMLEKARQDAIAVRNADQRAIETLLDETAALRIHVENTLSEIQHLQFSDPEVDIYLKTPIPGELRDILNR